MYCISKDNLNSLYAAIAGSYDLFMPIRTAGQTNYGFWKEGAEGDIDTLKTIRSGKDAFFPQVEQLYTVNREIVPADVASGEDAEKAADTPIRTKLNITPGKLVDQDFVIFGMRACDVRAIEVMDNVFLTDPVDSYYKSRREHGIVVALACHEPEESCFCTVFGVDPADPSKAKADVATWMIDGKLYWKAITEKGEALTAKVADLFEQEDADAKVEEEKSYIEGIAKQLPNAELSLEGWGAGKTDEKFKSEVWDKVYKGCLGCGTCTFVCPTCQCYDIKDYTTKDGIQRYRCWDSCMYSDFTLMAGGQNRQTQLQRFRQRFMHKLVYYPTN
ncbi:MAG: 4Fe-4S dicluster domain-containing protein, partial [Clostridiales bacterium]|nr:4Fe-4S dicluster domain-containing protein [Clostridiales bacterium]